MTTERKQDDMYINKGYLFNSRIPFKENKKALRVLSAGTYQLFTRPRLPTWRPKGRIDWQLIYIAAGEGHFILDGHEVTVPAGNMVLYPPKKEQHYYFLGKDLSQYWFVHFTGRSVKSILRHYEIPLGDYIIHTGISYQYEDLFKRMRDELQECEFCYEESLTYILRELFIVMNRRMNQNLPKASGFVRSEMDYARSYFKEHYNEDISIEQYSVTRNMSMSWFGACFREYFGTSPMKYILNLRIYNAQILLETTEDSVAEIARRVGYENPMYFSRAFRKAKGLSPMKYRKVFREKLLQEGQDGSLPEKD